MQNTNTIKIRDLSIKEIKDTCNSNICASCPLACASDCIPCPFYYLLFDDHARKYFAKEISTEKLKLKRTKKNP